MEQLFAICPTVKKGGDIGTDRTWRQFISVAASDIGCHRERISWVSHVPDAARFVTSQGPFCQARDLIPTICNSKCSSERTCEVCADCMEPICLVSTGEMSYVTSTGSDSPTLPSPQAAEGRVGLG
jgi:hypothetical protein